MGFLRQLRILCWRNFLLRRRQRFRLIVELVWPLALFILLAWIRLREGPERIPDCHFDEKAMPSAGYIPFAQSYMCNFNNTCKPKSTDTDYGRVDQFNSSIVSQIVSVLQDIFGDPKFPQAVVDMVHAGSDLYREVSANGGLVLKPFYYMPTNVPETTTSAENDSKFAKPLLWRDLLAEAPESLFIPMRQYGYKGNESTWKEAFQSSYPPGGIDLHRAFEILQHRNDSFCSREAISTFFNVSDDKLHAHMHAMCGMRPSELALAVLGPNIAYYKALSKLKIENLFESGVFSAFWSKYDRFIRPLPQLGQLKRVLFAIVDTFTQSKGSILPLVGKALCGNNSNVFDVENESKESIAKRLQRQFQGNGAQLNARPNLKREWDATMSKFCNERYQWVENEANLWIRMMFKPAKPFLLGKILYTPDTPATRRIIRRLNATAELITNILWGSRNTYATLKPILQAARSLVEKVELITLIERNETTRTFKPTDFILGGHAQEAVKKLLPFKIGTGDAEKLIKILRTVGTFQRLADDSVFRWLDCLDLDKFRGVASEFDLTEIGLERQLNDTFWAGIVFDNLPANQTDDTLPPYIRYKIRYDIDKVDSTTNIQDRFFRRKPRRDPLNDLKYLTYGWIQLQEGIDNAIIYEQIGSTDIPGKYVQQFPYPCYIYDDFVVAISRQLPLLITIGWIYSLAMLVKSIVLEKEKRLKEFMKMMGLSSSVHWLAWFVDSFVMMQASCIALTLVAWLGKVLMHSNPFCLYLLLSSVGICTIAVGFLLSVFFSQANIAAACAGVVFFLSYTPYPILLMWEDSLSATGKVFTSLVPLVSMGWGMNTLARFEEQGVGLQWANMWKSPLMNDDYFAAYSIIMLWVDAFVFFVLAWYLEAVLPGMYGIPRPWYFPFSRAYWCPAYRRSAADAEDFKHAQRAGPKKLKNTDDIDEENDAESDADEFDTYSYGPTQNMMPNGANIDPNNFEAEPRDRKRTITIKNLRKVYSNGKVAVDGLSLNAYEGITGLLGHNGAGKTTTFSILCGLFPATSGLVKIYGWNIRKNFDRIRKHLGFCPQHNVLYDLLTVEEHLKFYATLKEDDDKKVDEEVRRMIKDVGLPHKAHELASNLSGGMQRKLSVGIAFVGNAKCILLDEPTAGVDPWARRAIWNLLLRLRKGRTILMSTHFHSEADSIADRIAVVADGQLVCGGSAPFLKRRFGSGYHLTLVKSQTAAWAASGSGAADSSSAPVQRVVNFVRHYFTQAELVENVGAELHIRLPYAGASGVKATRQSDEQRASSFARLFRSLDENLIDLGIDSYGIRDTSLEEVFLKVMEQHGGETDPIRAAAIAASTANTQQSTNNLTTAGDQRQLGTVATVENAGSDDLLRRARVQLASLGLLSSDAQHERLRSEPPNQPAPPSSTPPTALQLAPLPLAAATTVANVSASPHHHLNPALSLGGSTSTIVPIHATSAAADPKYREFMPIRRVTGWRLIVQQIRAVLIKRYHHVRRSRRNFFCEIVLPVIFVVLAMLISKLMPGPVDQPPLELTPWLYGSPQNYIFFTDDSRQMPNNETMLKYLHGMYEGAELGTRCMAGQPVTGKPCVASAVRGSSDDLARPIKLPDGPPISCDCSSGMQHCPAGAGGPMPACITLNTTDVICNMTGRDVSDWLVKTNDDFEGRRYGGYSFGQIDYLAHYRNTSVVNMGHKIYADLMSDSDAAKYDATIDPAIRNRLKYLAEFLHDTFVDDNIKVWFNNRGWAASVSYMNAISNVILRAALPKNPNATLVHKAEEYGITTINHPLNRTEAQLQDEIVRKEATALLLACCIIFAMSFIPASFVMFIVEERQSGAKTLQMVSKLRPWLYWTGQFLWDYSAYALTTVLCMLVFGAFQENEYVGAKNWPALLLLLLMYGFSATPLMYITSWCFAVPSSAFVALSCGNLFVGLVTTLSVFTLSVMEDEELREIGHTLENVFLALPHYCMGRGMMDLAVNQIKIDILRKFGQILEPEPLAWEFCGRNIVYMLLQGLTFFAITLLIQYRFMFRPIRRWLSVACTFSRRKFRRARQKRTAAKEQRRRKNRAERRLGTEDGGGDESEENTTDNEALSSSAGGHSQRESNRNWSQQSADYLRAASVDDYPHVDEDRDVTRERQRVLTGRANASVLRCEKLTKVYGRTRIERRKRRPAVDNLTFAIDRGECFGLLGVNGAGKTTTFKILTGAIRPTAGTAFVCNKDLVQHTNEARKHLGYCPQFDALDRLVSGREHLEFYARLHGLPEVCIGDAVDNVVQNLALEKYQSKSAGTYSGGNKRKLNAAIAMVGEPDLLLFDEPSSGMDPKARRFLWDAILTVVRNGKSVALTSHSLEECENLCSRLSIMVNGRMQCIGSLQHLKSRYGFGYTVILRCDPSRTVVDAIRQGSTTSSMRARVPTATSQSGSGTFSRRHRKFTTPAGIERICSFMLQRFPAAIVQEVTHNTVKLRIPVASQISANVATLPRRVPGIEDSDEPALSARHLVTLAHLFEVIESHKTELGIDDASINQTTLEDIFIDFAKTQSELDQDEILNVLNTTTSGTFDVAATAATSAKLQAESPQAIAVDSLAVRVAILSGNHTMLNEATQTSGDLDDSEMVIDMTHDDINDVEADEDFMSMLPDSPTLRSMIPHVPTDGNLMALRRKAAHMLLDKYDEEGNDENDSDVESRRHFFALPPRSPRSPSAVAIGRSPQSVIETVEIHSPSFSTGRKSSSGQQKSPRKIIRHSSGPMRITIGSEDENDDIANSSAYHDAIDEGESNRLLSAQAQSSRRKTTAAAGGGAASPRSLRGVPAQIIVSSAEYYGSPKKATQQQLAEVAGRQILRGSPTPTSSSHPRSSIMLPPPDIVQSTSNLVANNKNKNGDDSSPPPSSSSSLDDRVAPLVVGTHAVRSLNRAASRDFTEPKKLEIEPPAGLVPPIVTVRTASLSTASTAADFIRSSLRHLRNNSNSMRDFQQQQGRKSADRAGQRPLLSGGDAVGGEREKFSADDDESSEDVDDDGIDTVRNSSNVIQNIDDDNSNGDADDDDSRMIVGPAATGDASVAATPPASSTLLSLLRRAHAPAVAASSSLTTQGATAPVVASAAAAAAAASTGLAAALRGKKKIAPDQPAVIVNERSITPLGSPPLPLPLPLPPSSVVQSSTASLRKAFFSSATAAKSVLPTSVAATAQSIAASRRSSSEDGVDEDTSAGEETKLFTAVSTAQNVNTTVTSAANRKHHLQQQQQQQPDVTKGGAASFYSNDVADDAENDENINPNAAVKNVAVSSASFAGSGSSSKSAKRRAKKRQQRDAADKTLS